MLSANPEIVSGIPSKEVIVCKIKRNCVDLLRYTKAIFGHGKSTFLLSSAKLSTAPRAQLSTCRVRILLLGVWTKKVHAFFVFHRVTYFIRLKAL